MLLSANLLLCSESVFVNVLFVHSLIPQVLAEGHPSYAARYMKQLLLNPPPYHIAEHLRSLLRIMMKDPGDYSITPMCPPISVGKVVSLLTARQANAATFREIASNLRGVATLLQSESPLIHHLMSIITYDSGLSTSHRELLTNVEKAYKLISETVALDETVLDRRDVPNRDTHLRIPDDFFYRNEVDIRGSISKGESELNDCSLRISRYSRISHNILFSDSSPLVQSLYEKVDHLAAVLSDAVRSDYPANGIDVVFDVLNNLVCFQRVKRSRVASEGIEEKSNVEFFHPLDRSYMPLARKYTTKRVDDALKAYLSATENLRREVKRQLVLLCSRMVEISSDPSKSSSISLVTCIVQSAHVAVTLNTALLHAYSSKQKGWTLPLMDSLDLMSDKGRQLCLHLKDLTPYWIDRSAAVQNNVDMNGIILLTAPNMSGKSTIMRATLVAALLANCGLCIPAGEGSSVPRYDCFFLRTTSHDIPSEGKSAFGLEMDDMRVILRDSTCASIVMIDEIGKGTSSRDGAAIAGAILEYLDSQNTSGIFATHLHEVLALPLVTHRMSKRRMGIKNKTESSKLTDPEWSYRLESGTCTDSMAIVTARAFGLPESIVQRAEALQGKYDSNQGSVHAPIPVKKVLNDLINLHKSREEVKSELEVDNETITVVHIPHGSVVPSSLEGHSCVYVLDIEKTTENVNYSYLYIGETESMVQRLHTHRRLVDF